MQDSTAQGFRLSPQQRQIWNSQQAFPGQPFRVVGAFVVLGSVDSEALRRALSLVVSRHEILRTRFVRPPGMKTPFQVISDDTNYFWRSIDLRNLTEHQQQDKLDEVFTLECKQPLTVDEGPVVRCHVAKLSDAQVVLLLSLPAMCADSQTLFNLAGEMLHASDPNRELPAEVVQYADFAEWQNQLLESDDERALEKKAYWKKRQIDPVPAVPLERRSSEERPSQYEVVTAEFAARLVNQLEALAVENETSLSNLIFIGWQSLISRLSGERDFTIYTRCDGRMVEDFRAALGPFDRYLPVQCQFENHLFVSQARIVAHQLKQVTDALEYTEPSDDQLIHGKALGFEYEDQTNWTIGALSFTPANQFVFTSPFKLKLSGRQFGKQLSLQLQYDGRVLHRETCERFIGYLQRLLQGLANTAPAARAQLRLDNIDILPESERQTLLVHLNETSRMYSHEKCVHECFEEQVSKTPAAMAVVCGEQQLTYEELNVRANQVAHLLIQSGVTPNTCVGMCLTGSVETIVALIGILKTGAAYVPLNPEHPLARLNAQMEKSQASICLTNTAGIAEALAANGRTIDFERDAELFAIQPGINPGVGVSSDGLAYAIYTSGSTGTPKAVAVRHRNLVNYTEFMLSRLRIEEPLHFATVSTISADLGNTCIFPSLFSGGCLHILRHDVALEPRLFSNYLSRHQIAVLKIAPSHMQALLSDSEEENVLPLKYLILGGEALSRQLLELILATPHTCKIINHYGPTETTVGSLTFDVTEQELSDLPRTVPIGRPIANTRAYILDKRMMVCPTSVVGELYIGGAGVAAGYLNDPDLTAVRFVPDAFSNAPDSRLYRTGDLVRSLPDGNIEFLGRRDLQVKVRGYRVELGEIEAVLSEHPLVRQVVVVLRREDGRERLVAYVMSSSLRPANTGELTEFLKQRLPDYMVPSAIVVLRVFP